MCNGVSPNTKHTGKVRGPGPLDARLRSLPAHSDPSRSGPHCTRSSVIMAMASLMIMRPSSKGSSSSFRRRRLLSRTCASSSSSSSSSSLKNWSSIQLALKNKYRVSDVDASDLPALVSSGKVTLVDVRPPNEYAEWHNPSSVNIATAKPRKNLLKRSIGFFIGIKGGLKEENEEFEQEAATYLPNKNAPVVCVCMKGGSLEPSNLKTNIDPTDSPSLRAAYRLCEMGYTNVRHVEGGLPLAIESGLDFSQGTWGELLTKARNVDPLLGTVRLAMYSRMLPDPSTAPGFVGQAVVFAAVGLYFKNDQFKVFVDELLAQYGVAV